LAYGLSTKNNDQRFVVPIFITQMQLELANHGANLPLINKT